jgi:hypothetical protein
MSDRGEPLYDEAREQLRLEVAAAERVATEKLLREWREGLAYGREKGLRGFFIPTFELGVLLDYVDALEGKG